MHILLTVGADLKAGDGDGVVSRLRHGDETSKQDYQQRPPQW
jgi:hypothetical protein